MHMWYPVSQLNVFGLKKMKGKYHNFRNENSLHITILFQETNVKKFCDTFLLSLEFLETLWTSGILKIPHFEHESVFEMNKYQEMVVLIK